MTIPTRNAAIATASAIFSEPNKYALIDLETTGVKANDQAVEIAVVAPDGNLLFHSCLKPSVSISPKNITAHGLTAAKLVGAPTITEVYERLAQAISGKTLIAYNANYDRRVLVATCEAFGLEPFGNEFLCAMEIRRQYDDDAPGELGGDHTAEGDCNAMAAMLRRIAQTELESARDEEVTPELLLELEAVQARIKELQERCKVIRSVVIAKLEATGNECYQPGNGLVFKNEPRTKYMMAEGVTIDDIDPAYVKYELDDDALRSAYGAGVRVEGIEVIRSAVFVLRRPKVKSVARRK